MKLIDYIGKLNCHEDYLKIINKLEQKSLYIEIVIISERESNELVDKLKEDIIGIKKVSKWWGTSTALQNNLYKIKASKKLFEYLRQYETFCKYYTFDQLEEDGRTNIFCGDQVEYTDFGCDDIVFYDDKELPLLYTTTHEGYIMIRDDLL